MAAVQGCRRRPRRRGGAAQGAQDQARGVPPGQDQDLHAQSQDAVLLGGEARGGAAQGGGQDAGAVSWGNAMCFCVCNDIAFFLLSSNK